MINECVSNKRFAFIVILILLFCLDFNLSQKSLELSKLFMEVYERITQQVPNCSFCADILEQKGIFNVVNSIKLLPKKNLVKHCKEPYQWLDGLRPGDVIGMEVRVTSENDELKVICTKENFLTAVLIIL